MQELFELKYHNSIFNVEIADHGDGHYSYQTYCNHGSCGDLLMGGFETINECIDYIKEECKKSAEYYEKEYHSILEAYGGEECFCESESWREIKEGVML